MFTPTTEQKLAAAIRNLELVYAAVKRIEDSETPLPSHVLLNLEELKHLSSPYNIGILGKV